MPRATVETKPGSGLFVHAKCRAELDGAGREKRPPEHFARVASMADPDLPAGMIRGDGLPELHALDVDEDTQREIESMGAQAGAAWAGRRTSTSAF